MSLVVDSAVLVLLHEVQLDSPWPVMFLVNALVCSLQYSISFVVILVVFVSRFGWISIGVGLCVCVPQFEWKLAVSALLLRSLVAFLKVKKLVLLANLAMLRKFRMIS